MGKVLAVNTSSGKGIKKVPLQSEAFLRIDHGIEGDAHAGNWHRQISLLAQESIDRMTALGVKDLSFGTFAENITSSGISLHTLPVGTRFRMGTALVELSQVGKECHHHCEIYQQVGMCIMPTEGIFVKVLEEGTVKAGDDIEIVYRPLSAWIIIASDKSSRGEREDLSGPAIKETLSGIAVVNGMDILPDERDQLSGRMKEIADKGMADLVFTSGGTGFSPRDCTPEATLDIVERCVPGIPEAMRSESMRINRRAILSRAAAGIRKQTLIINLPGSPKAVKECLSVILDVLPHAVETLRGNSYECATQKDSGRK